jgi:hypothetical protein
MLCHAVKKGNKPVVELCTPLKHEGWSFPWLWRSVMGKKKQRTFKNSNYV